MKLLFAAVLFSQAAPPDTVIGWFQTGGMASVAAVLLWVFIRERQDFQRSLNAISTTNLTFQSMLLTMKLTQRVSHETGSVECAECLRRIQALEQLMEAQRKQLAQDLKR